MSAGEDKKLISPLQLASALKWLGKPMIESIEPYRKKIMMDVLYSFGEDGSPVYKMALMSRAKKNWKSWDMVFGLLWRLMIWESPLGNQNFLVASDSAQAGDDLGIAKKMIFERGNEFLADHLIIRKSIIERKDGKGFLEILSGVNVDRLHGISFLTVGHDEIHTRRNWDVFEALSPDPHRPDAQVLITSYASIYNFKGVPLHDFFEMGKEGKMPGFYFSWYGADYGTNPDFVSKETPEERANPSVLPKSYFESQKKILPSARYRRLHLNLPGSPEGAFFNADKVEEAVGDHKRLPFKEGVHYSAFVDMAGGSNDDSTLAVSHVEGERVIIDGVWDQGRKAPYDPRDAVELFAGILREYGISRVMGDRYAGNTFQADFEKYSIGYEAGPVPKNTLYEALEVELNSGRVTLPDSEKLIYQLLSLVMKGGKIDHSPGELDDYSNSVAGAVFMQRRGREVQIGTLEEHEIDIGVDRSLSILAKYNVDWFYL